MTGPSTDMTYGGYLHLDQVLDAQHPRTGAHDEMLFIIQHQTSELWMRLVLHEIGAARDMIANGHLQPAFKMLTRVARIFDQLNSAWDVLRTMTPSEYTRFRGELGSSSGFQSHQYRLIEYALGNRNLAMRRIHDHTPEIAEMLSDELTRPSLYQVALRVLETETGSQFEDTAYTLEGPYQAHASVAEAWTVIYRNPDDHWDLYELAEKLVDLEDYFRRWRFNHVTTVERIIGFKKGTGGTAGVPYLRQMLSVELFPELWSLRGGL